MFFMFIGKFISLFAKKDSNINLIKDPIAIPIISPFIFIEGIWVNMKIKRRVSELEIKVILINFFSFSYDCKIVINNGLKYIKK